MEINGTENAQESQAKFWKMFFEMGQNTVWSCAPNSYLASQVFQICTMYTRPTAIPPATLFVRINKMKAENGIRLHDK